MEPIISDAVKIPWWRPVVGDKERELVVDVLDRSFPNEGELTRRFEDEICELTGAAHATAVTSGTAALFLSLKACGVGYGDEVVVPDITFIASANAVEMCGAKPVLVDVEERNLNIDPAGFRKAVTKKTKAVIPVHVSGRAADMDQIVEIAQEKDILVVEDAAEAFTSKSKGKSLGTIGDVGCFSFSPHKIITTGQGGAIVTDEEDIYLGLRKLKDHGRPVRGTGGDDVHDTIGYNFKFTDLQAAVGLGQLTYLSDRAERLRKNHEIYSSRLDKVAGLSLLEFGKGELPLWTDVVVEGRDRLDNHLSEAGMDCRRYWLPLHKQKPYKLPDKTFPNSTRLSPRALWLPSAYTLTDDQVEKVCETIIKFLGR